MWRRHLLWLLLVPVMTSAETFKEAVERKQRDMEEQRQLEAAIRRQRAEERRERQQREHKSVRSRSAHGDESHRASGTRRRK